MGSNVQEFCLACKTGNHENHKRVWNKDVGGLLYMTDCICDGNCKAIFERKAIEAFRNYDESLIERMTDMAEVYGRKGVWAHFAIAEVGYDALYIHDDFKQVARQQTRENEGFVGFWPLGMGLAEAVEWWTGDVG